MDKEYWEKFYKNSLASEEPSSFALYIEKYFLKSKKHILELGSGNGRDSVYFSQNKHNVVAVDQSHATVQNKHKNKDVQFVIDNFVTMDYSKFKNIDVIYSRFTLHAIQEDECKKVVEKSTSLLKKGGLFAIEARTTNDDLCGEGKNLGNNIWFTDHSRRFIDSHQFLLQVLDQGKFKILYFTERNNLSIYKTDNPVLMRLVLEKL